LRFQLIRSWLASPVVSPLEPAVQTLIWSPLPQSCSLVFLDFDGVMHRAENGSFEREPELSALLDFVPDAFVVLSTNWRVNADRSFLLSHFSDSLHPRIVGVNDDCPKLPYAREAECLQTAHRVRPRAFVAVDDDASLFSPACTFLHLTDRYQGLTNDDVSTLVVRLTRPSP
jgi:hypothetical protein